VPEVIVLVSQGGTVSIATIEPTIVRPTTDEDDEWSVLNALDFGVPCERKPCDEEAEYSMVRTTCAHVILSCEDHMLKTVNMVKKTRADVVCAQCRVKMNKKNPYIINKL
jgi:hypothetical protein